MRRVLLPLLFVVLCLGLPGLCRGGQAAVAAVPGAAASADAGAAATAGASGVPADAGAPAAPGAAPAPVPAVDGGNPIPDVPPPGWTEEQLARLRALELQLRHGDIDPILDVEKPALYYDVTLFARDASLQGKTQPLCIRRIYISTNVGGRQVRGGPGECLGYEFLSLRTEDLSAAKEIRIRSARMDVAPYRDAPESDTLRNLDVTPLLRAVPLPPVKLTMSGRPLPKMPENIPAPTAKNPWPSKLRVHLAAAFTDTRNPDLRCYSLLMAQAPREAESIYGIHLRTNIGDYKDMGAGIGFYAILCTPGGTDHIDIKHATVWLASKRKLKAVHAGPMLVDDGFVPLPFVKDKGPLPPPAEGMYPPRWKLGSGDPED